MGDVLTGRFSGLVSSWRLGILRHLGIPRDRRVLHFWISHLLVRLWDLGVSGESEGGLRRRL